MQTTTFSNAASGPGDMHSRSTTPSTRALYFRVLTWAFTLFNSIRVLSYVPTLLTIHASGDSVQHSILTWGTWVAANATMAAWLYESNGQRFDRVVAVNCLNMLMCLVTLILIVWYRL